MVLTKHLRIRNDLKAKIARGIYKPGDAIPSQQQLMSEYGVAQGTVRQALEQLQADGLVVSHRGKGSYVCEPSKGKDTPAPTASMGLVIVSDVQNDWIVNDQLLRFQNAAARLSYEFAVRVFDLPEEEAAAKWAQRHTGVVVWGAARRAFINRLIEQGLPVVVMGELLDGDCPPAAGSIRFDPDSLVSSAVQLMTGLGHRRIWFINRGSSAYFRTLSRLFAQHAQATGIESISRQVILERIEEEPSLVNLLIAAEDKPTALLIEGDIRACRFIHVLQNAGWPVPQRISVMALGAAEPNRLSVHDLSRVLSTPDVGVVRAAEALAEMIDVGRVVRYCVGPRLILGKTCIPVSAESGAVRSEMPQDEGGESPYGGKRAEKPPTSE